MRSSENEISYINSFLPRPKALRAHTALSHLLRPFKLPIATYVWLHSFCRWLGYVYTITFIDRYPTNRNISPQLPRMAAGARNSTENSTVTGPPTSLYLTSCPRPIPEAHPVDQAIPIFSTTTRSRTPTHEFGNLSHLRIRKCMEHEARIPTVIQLYMTSTMRPFRPKEPTTKVRNGKSIS